MHDARNQPLLRKPTPFCTVQYAKRSFPFTVLKNYALYLKTIPEQFLQSKAQSLWFKSRLRGFLIYSTRNHQKFTFLPGLLRTPYEIHAHSTSWYPPPFLFNEPLESD